MSWRISFEFDSRDPFRQAWGYLCQECSVPEAWERGTPLDMRKMWSSWLNYSDTTTALDLPDPLVVVNAQESPKVPGLISLYDFEHPENASYYFGSDRRNIVPADLEGREYQCVYIPDTGQYYSFQAAAVVIYDRKMKCR